jgi:hypothetical protein
MADKQPVYRIGDHVTIVDPQLVVRVGYPLGLAAGRDYIMRNHLDAVKELFSKVGGLLYPPFTGFVLGTRADYSREFNKVVDSLAYAYICSMGHGGSARSVHAVEVPGLAGTSALVVGRKVAYSGIRRSESEDEGPSFKRTAAHVLLEVALDRCIEIGGVSEGTAWIEASRVSLLHRRGISGGG